MLSVILMPGVVLIIPLYVIVAHVGMANSFFPAILIYAAINIPFGTYLLRTNFRNIPDGLIDAARVDGAGWLRVFWAIVLPAGRAAVTTVGILTFLNVWNELFISIVLLHTPGTEMVTPTLTEINGRYTTDMPVLLSGLLAGCPADADHLHADGTSFRPWSFERVGAVNGVTFGRQRRAE